MEYENDVFLHQIDEKILCYHGPIIYEAKIIKAQYLKEKGPYYYVHYIGWKQTWDEWVPQCRVLKCNEENLKIQQQIMNSLEKKNKTVDKPSETAATAAKKKAGVLEKGKKRKREISIKKTDDIVKKSKIIIDLPDALRTFMLHDCNNIKSRMFVPLPRKPTVSDIISDYRVWRCEKLGNKDSCNAEEIIIGVHFYFNRCLGTRLLYQLERQQYKEMREKFKHLDNSQIYGAEHLLRLFGNIKDVTLSQETLNVLKEHLNDLLVFLNEHRDKYFINEYQNTSRP
ncbi:MRG-domain-containing protein [Gigaspora rosea]|uniref:Chromatin modification-related protein EAF3 n=1 Tax=Gigaspora rosea TaxID=44941 RepID=A0A397VEQ5_9GLOM|nr:MRG-domain-containing protein [Gigaspora rosea]